MLVMKIYETLVCHFSVVNLLKEFGWFFLNSHRYKQIICVGSPTIHIFNLSVSLSWVDIESGVQVGWLGFMAYQPLNVI